jgi:hypothetical protein
MKKFLLVTAAAVCAFSASASADETIKYRGVLHIVAAQTQDVGDVEGHTMSLIRGQGLAFLPDGGIGQNTFVSITDYINGNGQFTVYQDLMFSDGSVIWYKGLGQANVQGNKTVDLKIPVTVIGGKGRYAGAKGEGMLTGTRMQPLPGMGAEIVNELTLTVKK